jgi:predicted AAA+ superfamily ATPase
VHRYDASLKRQYLWDKKIYAADNGLRNSVAFRTSPDSGRLLENLVFIELRRRQEEVWFYRNAGGTEVDFYVPSGTEKLIQVCYDMSDPATLDREKSALEKAIWNSAEESYISQWPNEKKSKPVQESFLSGLYMNGCWIK